MGILNPNNCKQALSTNNLLKNKLNKILVIISALIIVTSCSELNNNLEQEELKSTDIESIDIQLLPYAEEVGFSLEAPESDNLETNATFQLKGNLEKETSDDWNHIWLIVTSENTEEDSFNYYIEIEESGKFAEQITLHQGEGTYDVTVRAPSIEGSEKGIYYDVATFHVVNLDNGIKYPVEYTAFGSEHGITLTSPEQGLSELEDSVYIEGTIAGDNVGDIVLVQVEKDDEAEQVILPVIDRSFSGEVPLYFGKGLHTITVQSYNEDDELYYDSAYFYTKNSISTEFAEVLKTNEYIERGITLHEPSWTEKKTYNELEYRVTGEVDQTKQGADNISYVIVTINYLDEGLESEYLIPVNNYQFDGLAYFRFGPGDYEVIISVPTIEQLDPSKFQYEGIAKVNHTVIDIENDRSILPSRGIESDHEAIINQANQLTTNLSNDREKAKAIYKFVAQHVAYDVNKAENDIFNISDSALSTLESGNGICQDYAFLATALLRAIGLESHYIHGDAGERHAWVEVKVDEEWIEMDPTWGAGYVQEGVFHFHYTEDYFDPDPAFLAETHTRDGVMY